MMLTKKYFLVFIFIIINVSAFSQRNKKPLNLSNYDFKKIHFGFTLGINALNFNIQKQNSSLSNDSLLIINSQDQKGFNLGIISNFRLGKYTDFRFTPSLVFGERLINYNFNNSDEIVKRIESTLIDFPFYLKYKSARYNNFRTYLLGGIKYSLDIASHYKIDDDLQEIFKLNNNDIMLEGGFGIDFYLEYFKFSPQIKISHGILNLLSKDNTVYTESIKNLRTNGWMLSFTFE
jgi:hypothetical protein